MCFLVVYRSKVKVIIEKHNPILFFELFETYITFVILRKMAFFYSFFPNHINKQNATSIINY